tara:strand:+ start:4643 stop:5041 length:399 start_codon:yes stop_codon:yes gene_type:complete
MIKHITHKRKILAIIIKSNYLKKKGVNFFTNPKLNQQVAYMNHPKKHLIQPHTHKNSLRKIKGTTEVLLILDGILKINFFDNKKKYIFSNTVKKNDIVILLSGGHGFEVMKNCKMIEVKQGPYSKIEDKFKF